MAVKNSTVIAKAWLEGTNDFQQRIPNPEINGYAATIDALFAPYNNDLFNAFTMLLNGINQTYVESKRFTNPLRSLMKPSIRFGNTERHVAVKYLKAHAARPDDETLLKMELPEFREFFYSVNAPRRYEFSWPRYELERAFADPDGYGYNDLLNATLDQMISSNEYDQMNIMLQMFAEGDARLGGLHRVNLSGAPSNKATAQELLQKIRAVGGKMKFPSTLYNNIDIPVFESPETLVLWATPDVLSVLDVFALAELLNWPAAEVPYRVIEIPEFPIPNVYAALTSEDFIYCREVAYGVEPPFYNPSTRSYKYYLFDSEMIGVNPVANCALFTTESSTSIPTITQAVTGIAFSPDSGNIEPGGTLQLKLALAGTISDNIDDLIEVEPDAATFAITGVDSDSAPLDLNSRTFVDKYGVLHLQKSGVEAGDVLTITATAAYINPSGSTSTFTDDFTATVV